MAPTDSAKLASESNGTETNAAEGSGIQQKITNETTTHEEMVTSFIDESPKRVKERQVDSASAVTKEEAVSGKIQETNCITEDPGEGTSTQSKHKSVVIDLTNEPHDETSAEFHTPEKLVTNSTSAVTAVESSVQVFDEIPLGESKKTVTAKNTKRYELQGWDSKRSCFFVFFLLLFVIWLIAYYLYASDWLYRKINHIR